MKSAAQNFGGGDEHFGDGGFFDGRGFEVVEGGAEWLRGAVVLLALALGLLGLLCGQEVAGAGLEQQLAFGRPEGAEQFFEVGAAGSGSVQTPAEGALGNFGFFGEVGLRPGARFHQDAELIGEVAHGGSSKGERAWPLCVR